MIVYDLDDLGAPPFLRKPMIHLHSPTKHGMCSFLWFKHVYCVLLSFSVCEAKAVTQRETLNSVPFLCEIWTIGKISSESTPNISISRGKRWKNKPFHVCSVIVCWSYLRDQGEKLSSPDHTTTFKYANSNQGRNLVVRGVNAGGSYNNSTTHGPVIFECTIVKYS